MDSLRAVVFRFADAEFEQLSGALSVAGQVKRLRPQTAAVLAQLVEHAGQLVSHDTLIQTVWGDTIVTDNSLAQCISEIRSALGSTPDSVIETVPRRGYILQAIVTIAPTPKASESTAQAPVSSVLLPKAGKAPSPRWLMGVAGAVGVFLLAALWFGVKLIGNPEPVPLSLAVLPFQTRTVASDQAWFAENMGEDITMNLSRIPGARVIARVSTQAYSNPGADLRQIGQDLGVRYVVAGHVDRVGDQVFMNLYLADTASGSIRWTERFESTVAQLESTERRVADRVANALHVSVVAAEAKRLEAKPNRNLVADELALEAWAAWNRGSPSDVARAKELAQKALDLDDRSVLAWKTMASWHLRARISQSIPAETAVAGAELAAQHAMDIDPEHPLVHTVYGAALALRGRHEEAQTALEHEIATNPSHPVAYYYLGLSFLMRGQPQQAIVQYQRALDISPRDPRGSRFHRYLALAHLHNHDLSSAIRHAKAATQMPMVDRTGWAMLASVCALSGDQPCTESAVAKLRQLWPAFTIAQGESEWPPARQAFTTLHADYLRGLSLAGFKASAEPT